MRRTYNLILDVEGPDDTNLDYLDRVVEGVIQWSPAAETIDTGIFGACDHLNIDVMSLRVEYDAQGEMVPGRPLDEDD